ncbi:bifunctional GNAT family N-acetyltransferase/acetate--CoA ligase family protein [Streptomyces sp. WMMB 322]|uniref:bifunctional acetate--CoA ligase family protein/GNAT family N-acetyltransferase n=1 Tax=Streptomyces sp. WMMB 322 TaxID=1286821 RepID=UPI0006E25BE8|nr:bifunctional GNAT family N-acetyltransferase/acetate--CoA ligase family protein [Streptomyces sp. WMMB 322]SCK15759.1 Acyl-CoA synthetase (NDP forming) [Streptomyces sp. WMMB 322]
MTYAAPRMAETYALLTDGRTVQIRPARPSDRGQVEALYEGMSQQDHKQRFFGAGAGLREREIDRVFGPGRSDLLVLLALHGSQLIGTAEYEKLLEEPAAAEIALAVADGFQHCGVGTLLLEHLAHAARAEHITTFTADALAENRDVLDVFENLGLRYERTFENGEVRCRVDLTPHESYLAAVDARGSTADVASMRPLLQPRSVAVVGAGRSPKSVGRAVLRNLRRSGFTGAVHGINPHAASIEGFACRPAVSELPHTPDLAVIAVPAHAVPEAADQCGRFGVRALTVLTSGLDEALGGALLDICRHYGMRLVGPDCLGIANTEDGIRLDATFAADLPEPGTAGVAVQSGGVGIALLSDLARLGIGVSSFVSLGDKYDVSGNDLLQWWEADERTRVGLLHLESFGNPRAFSRTARRVTRLMPVLTVDAGRSDAGRRAAAGHTAAAATPAMTRQALFHQAGVTATLSLGDLTATAALMHSQPLPTGTSVAVVSNAGGTGVLTADACDEAGLTLPELPEDVAAELRTLLPEAARVANPLDTTAAVGRGALAECVELLSTRAPVDAVLVVLVPTATAAAGGDDLVRAAASAEAPGGGRTLVTVLPDQSERVRLVRTPGGTGPAAVPAYADPQDAARALAHAAARSRWLAHPPGHVPDLSGRVDTDRARTLVQAALSEHPEGTWLDPDRCGHLLDLYGIPRVPQSVVRDRAGAVREAARLAPGGGRLALKAYGPDLLHKSAHGAVVLDLEGPDAAGGAFRDLRNRLGERMDGAIVQPMAGRGVELIAGVVQDDVFGPLVLFGLGGTATDVLADHAARLAPLTDRDVHELVAAPLCAPTLRGQGQGQGQGQGRGRGRGSGEAVDLPALEDLLLRVSKMADDLPELAEADLNPVLARPDGVAVLDCRIRLAHPRPPRPGRGTGPHAYPRRLR